MSHRPSAAWIEPGAKVADGATVHPLAFVGPEVEIGQGSEVFPHAVLIGRVVVGCRVRVGPGAVIGWDGFGYEQQAGGYRRLEHGGPVVIEDDVDIGANVTIARARTGRETRIGRGTKIDSLVHIGHNVRIGRDCAIVAQVGIAGSAVIGDGVQLAGQSGVKDHVTIGDGAVVYAKSAVFRSIPAGAKYSGIPARPHGLAGRFWARLWRRYGRDA